MSRRTKKRKHFSDLSSLPYEPTILDIEETDPLVGEDDPTEVDQFEPILEDLDENQEQKALEEVNTNVYREEHTIKSTEPSVTEPPEVWAKLPWKWWPTVIHTLVKGES